MNFKSSEQLIARVNSQLSSFQSAGLLDHYRLIKEIIAKLNIPAFSPVHRIANIENSRLQIPDDLYQIWAIYRYGKETKKLAPELYKQNEIRTRISTYECYDPCGDPCELEVEPNILVTKTYVANTPYIQTYEHGQLLSLKNYKIDRCDQDSPSIHNKSSLEVTMDSNYFYFNFETGSIYLQYFKMMLDEDGLPMIPDVVQIELAIEYYLLYRFFQEAYINNWFDAFQRMQYFEAKYQEAYQTAKSWHRLPTARSLIEYGKLMRNKYNIYRS